MFGDKDLSCVAWLGALYMHIVFRLHYYAFDVGYIGVV